MIKTFEIGNIYAPLEKESIFVRLTHGCKWNKCIFCDSYSNQHFKIRPVEEIKNDLNTIYELQNTVNGSNLNTIFFKRAQKWKNAKTIFFEDTDVLFIETNKLLNIIDYIKKLFPYVQRFSSYASVKNLNDKPINELKELYKAKFDRFYIGLESGCKETLKLIKKDIKYENILYAHKKAIEIGFKLFDHYIIGIGGRTLSKQHALKSAKILNFINPYAVEIRTTIVSNGTELERMKNENIWKMLSKEGLNKELKLFLETLNFDGWLFSDHYCNLYRDMNGKFKENKLDFIKKIKIY